MSKKEEKVYLYEVETDKWGRAPTGRCLIVDHEFVKIALPDNVAGILERGAAAIETSLFLRLRAIILESTKNEQ